MKLIYFLVGLVITALSVLLANWFVSLINSSFIINVLVLTLVCVVTGGFLFLIKNVSGENCNNFTLPNGQVICVSSEGNKFSESKDTPLGEVSSLKIMFHKSNELQISASIPPGDKDGLYYFVISMFVVSTFTSTILTGTFLVLSIILWPHFKQVSDSIRIIY